MSRKHETQTATGHTGCHLISKNSLLVYFNMLTFNLHPSIKPHQNSTNIKIINYLGLISMSTVTRFLTVVALTLTMVGTASAGKVRSNSLNVTATAYNSTPSQTDGTPDIAAWGDRLRPGMKAIAVSKDLLKQHGLSRGDTVKIAGLGEFIVLDKMHPRWRKKIDIYMGTDRSAAKRWGRKKVMIHW
jgi:3D (Asp-Asp-Asp) domain-containing protein